MDEKLKIYVKPKRGRLPRRYEFVDSPSPTFKRVKWIAIAILTCVLAIAAYRSYATAVALSEGLKAVIGL